MHVHYGENKIKKIDAFLHLKKKLRKIVLVKIKVNKKKKKHGKVTI